MKKYFAPEMTTMLFTAAEMIANGVDEETPVGASNIFNDDSFGNW